MINEDFLKSQVSDFTCKFYICGPPPMMDAVTGQLALLGAKENSVVLEV